jgi:hypothetical protein
MALALIYIFLTAKSVSMRRLATLFVLTLILATTYQGILGARNGQSKAIFIAASVTALAWVIPPLQAAFDTVRHGSLRLHALRCASIPVQWSYAFAVATGFASVFVLVGAPHLHLADLPKVLAMIGIAAVVLQAGLSLALRQ